MRSQGNKQSSPQLSTTEFWHGAEAPHLEVRRSCQSVTCYRPHTHDSISVGLIDHGGSRLSGPLTGPVELMAGDVVLIGAGQVHDCNPVGGRWQYQMIHIDPNWVSSTLDAEHDSRVGGVTIIRSPALFRRLSAWVDALFAVGSSEASDLRLAELLQALASVSAEHLVTHQSEPELVDALAPVLVRLATDAANPPLDELAAAVSMTRFQLIRAVKRATGLTPLAWRQNARISRARHLLREGQPIADTAYELGFTDQSHFHRLFRSHVAASPGVYRGA